MHDDVRCGGDSNLNQQPLHAVDLCDFPREFSVTGEPLLKGREVRVYAPPGPERPPAAPEATTPGASGKRASLSSPAEELRALAEMPRLVSNTLLLKPAQAEAESQLERLELIEEYFLVWAVAVLKPILVQLIDEGKVVVWREISPAASRALLASTCAAVAVKMRSRSARSAARFVARSL